jgi:hypothetical protein
MYPKGGNITSVKVIGVRQGKLYRLVFESAGAMSCMTSSRDMCEIWHWRMGHIHHGSLRILREITIGIPYLSVENHDLCRGCAMGKYTKASFPTVLVEKQGFSI